MTYREIVKKIRNLEIQGAENIAVKAVEAFSIKLKETKDRSKLNKYFEELKSLRATEPGLRNALKFCLENFEKNKNVTAYVINHFKKSKEKIAEYGSKKIHSGMKVFTHCHSSTVEAILIKAKKQGKNFTVYNTETRPKFQGRITAQELAKEGIPIVHFVDSAGRSMLRKCDLFLFGCDALTSDGKVVNKIGTEMLAECAKDSHIEAYSCTNSWKFDPKTLLGYDEEIEQRNPKEVWDKPPKGVKIYNPAFEIISPDIFSGVISELGIYKPETMIMAVKKAYPWITE